MPTKELQTITSLASVSFKNNLIEQLKLCQDIFKNLHEFPKKKDYKLILEIFEFDDQVNYINSIGIDTGINTFMKAPLGKDLRRNVSYLMISRSLQEISHNGRNIAKYINKISGFSIDKKWIFEISEKIYRRVQSLEKLLNSEDVTKANQLIKRDETVNVLYKNLLKKFSSSASTKKKLTNKEKDTAILGFIMALKNFERAGDAISEASEAILFISSGKF